jgi:integrase
MAARPPSAAVLPRSQAGELDRHAKAKGGHDQKGGPVYRRALLATLVFAGLRLLDKAVERANEKLTKSGDSPLPEGLTPHKLRHTFASILVALGIDPGSVMDQLGHTDPGFTLRVYRHVMRRDRAARERLRALVGGAEWAPSGTGAQSGALAQFVAVGPPGANTA